MSGGLPAINRLVGAKGAVNVTKSNETVYSPPLRAVSIGTAGDLAVRFVGETDPVTIPSNCLAVGVQHAMQVDKIMSDNTDAAEIVGWY